MKKLAYILVALLFIGVPVFAFDIIGAGVTAVDLLKNGGKMSAREKQLYEKELEKERQSEILKADKQMKICVEWLSIDPDKDFESQIMESGRQDWIDYYEVVKTNEAERNRCINRQDREILIQEQEQKQYEAMLKNTSYLYQLLEL